MANQQIEDKHETCVRHFLHRKTKLKLCFVFVITYNCIRNHLSDVEVKINNEISGWCFSSLLVFKKFELHCESLFISASKAERIKRAKFGDSLFRSRFGKHVKFEAG